MRLFLSIVLTYLAFSALPTTNLRAEWRWGIFLGKASTSPSDLNIKQSAKQNDLLFHHIEYNDKSFHTPLYYGLRTGYFPGCSDFGLEAEFIHAKIYSKSQQQVYVSGIRQGEPIDSIIRLGEIVQGFSMTHGLNFLFFNLVSRLRLFKSKDDQLDKVTLYGRVGTGPLIPHTESVIDGERREQYELHGPAYQLAAGAQINILKKVALFVEGKYTYVKIKDAKIAHGHASTQIKTKHLIFGVAGGL